MRICATGRFCCVNMLACNYSTRSFRVDVSEDMILKLRISKICYPFIDNNN